MGFADVNGTRLYYESVGTGHPLVLVHGFSLDTRMWDDQVEASSERYRVIQYDVRGYGKSSVPGTAGYYHADDLKGLLDFLGIEQAHVVGLSMGAAIVTEFALAYPEMVSALVASDPVLWGYSWSPEFEATMARIWGAGRAEGIEAARSMWLNDPLFAPAMETPEVASRLREIVESYSGWHWNHDDPGLLPDPPAAGRLEEITAPTLALVGERDLADYRAIASTLARRIPGARKVVLQGAGHMSNMEKPQAFNNAVLTFLDAI